MKARRRSDAEYRALREADACVVVCGSRNWPARHAQKIRRRLVWLPSNTIVVTGGARGVDNQADYFAGDLGLDRIVFKANWKRHGKQAGPIRNRRMLDTDPVLVIAFRAKGESRGTDDCINEAARRGIPVEVIYEDTDVPEEPPDAT